MFHTRPSVKTLIRRRDALGSLFDPHTRESVRDGRCIDVSVSSMRHSGAKTIQYDSLAYRHVKLLHTVKRKEVG